MKLLWSHVIDIFRGGANITDTEQHNMNRRELLQGENIGKRRKGGYDLPNCFYISNQVFVVTIIAQQRCMKGEDVEEE